MTLLAKFDLCTSPEAIGPLSGAVMDTNMPNDEMPCTEPVNHSDEDTLLKADTPFLPGPSNIVKYSLPLPSPPVDT